MAGVEKVVYEGGAFSIIGTTPPLMGTWLLEVDELLGVAVVVVTEGNKAAVGGGIGGDGGGGKYPH